MGEYDISQWRLAGTQIQTPSDPKMATGVRTGFMSQRYGPAIITQELVAENGLFQPKLILA